MDYLALLKALITNTDLAQYLEDASMLDYAVEYAKSEITIRYGVEDFSQVPAKYGRYVVEGAKWYLSMIGVEGQSSMTENGISRTYKDTPDWLSRIIPKVGVIKNASATETENPFM